MRNMSVADKRVALEALPSQYENRLFFAARNLAIEALLLRIETKMLRAGFDVVAEWRESSHYAPIIYLKLKNPKPNTSAWEYATAQVHLKRDTIKVPHEKASECFYTLDSVAATEYWPYKQSKYVLGFRDLVVTLAGDGYFTAEVNKVNYPFDYSSHSSF